MTDASDLERRIRRLEEMVAALATSAGVDANLAQEWLCASRESGSAPAEHFGQEVFESIKGRGSRSAA